MENSKDSRNPRIPGQPESSSEKSPSKQERPAKPSQAEGDEETVEKALRNQERKSK